MRFPHRRSLATVFLVSVLVTPGLQASSLPDRVEEAAYVAGTGDLTYECVLGVGAVCFDLDGTEDTVTIDIRDDRGDPTPATLRLVVEGFVNIAHTVDFCDTTTKNVTGWDRVEVVFHAAEAPLGSCGAPATTGTVHARFTRSSIPLLSGTPVSASSTDCRLDPTGGPTPGGVSCSVTQSGVVSSSASDCDALGCKITATASATGNAEPSGPLALHTSLWAYYPAYSVVTYATVCSTSSSLTGHISCQGAASLGVSVAAGGCQEFWVDSSLRSRVALNVDAFGADAADRYELCRASDGTPAITAL